MAWAGAKGSGMSSPAAPDWRRIARTSLASRFLDDLEESTNARRGQVPRDHLVLYQFSARGHEVSQALLAAALTHPRDAASVYYRCRPLVLGLGVSLEEALVSSLARSGSFSEGRDAGAVFNRPGPGPVVLPMAGDVGSQYTPAVGWAQAARFHREVLRDPSWDGAVAVVLGGEASVASNGFWSALTMATTLSLPVLFFVQDNGLGLSVRSGLQTPGGNIARNLAGFANLLVGDGDGTDPVQASALLAQAMAHVRSGAGPALLRLEVPRLCGHSGPDNQAAYRSREELEAEALRDPLPRLREFLVPARMSAREWQDVEREVQAEVEGALQAARARPAPRPSEVGRFLFEEEDAGLPEPQGGLSRHERSLLPGCPEPQAGGPRLRFAEALRRTLAVDLERNPKLVVFGEDVGRKGGVHLVTEGLQRRFGEERVFDTSLSEEGIVGRAVGMALAGLVPVAEIQFRKYADPATEQLNNCGLVRWRTFNRFAAPIVVRTAGGYGKDVGDPWHSLCDEVRFVHAYGWQVAIPSNAADAVGLLRTAMRSPNPTFFFEHRSLLMTGEGSAPYPGDDYLLPFGQGRVMCPGTDLTVVTWGAMVHRAVQAASRFGGRVEVLDLRTLAPWDRELVLASVRRTSRCLVVHEDNRTAGFGAEVAATLAREAFWDLDAPVERLAPEDIPAPYHPDLLQAVIPGVEVIADFMERILSE